MESEVEKKVCVVDKTSGLTMCFEGETEGLPEAEAMLKAAIRNAVRAEFDAVNAYETIAMLAEGVGERSIAKLAKDIANEERKHAGEFMQMLFMLDVLERAKIAEGTGEASMKLLEYEGGK